MLVTTLPSATEQEVQRIGCTVSVQTTDTCFIGYAQRVRLSHRAVDGLNWAIACRTCLISVGTAVVATRRLMYRARRCERRAGPRPSPPQLD